MTYEQFEKECNRVLTNMIGLGIHDLEDACWRDYYEDGLHPLEAINCANEDAWGRELSFVLHG